MKVKYSNKSNSAIELRWRKEMKNSWPKKFPKLTNAPRPLVFFPAAKIENFELEQPLLSTNLSQNCVNFTEFLLKIKEL